MKLAKRTLIVLVLLVFSLQFCIVPKVFAAQDPKIDSSITIVEKQFIDGETVTYKIMETEMKKTVTYRSKNIDHTIIVMKETGLIFLDGVPFDLLSEVEPSADEMQTMRWIEVSRTTGSLGTDVRDVATLAALLVVALSVPWAGAVTVAGVIFARGLDRVYYTKVYYYDDATLNRWRPVTKTTYYFYSNSARSDLIWTI